MFVWESDGKYIFFYMNFGQIMNRDIKIPGKGLYSPNLRDLHLHIHVRIFTGTLFTKVEVNSGGYLPIMKRRGKYLPLSLDQNITFSNQND